MYKQVRGLFAEQPDLLDEFMVFLPDTSSNQPPAHAPKRRSARLMAKETPTTKKPSDAHFNEVELFYDIKEMLSPEEFSELVKVFYLYNKKVISAYQVAILTCDTLIYRNDIWRRFTEFLGIIDPGI